MRILRKNAKEGSLKLLLDTMDDLWFLSTIIEVGDLVSAVTYRRGEEKTDAIRDKRVEKKRMFLTLKVEKLEFHEFSERLRVLGVITEGPQDHGEHHTFDLEAGNDITIKKEAWQPHHIERLREAQEASKMPLLTLLSIDDESATLAVLRPQGLQVLANISANMPGKDYEQKAKGEKEAFFDEVLSTLENHFKGQAARTVLGTQPGGKEQKGKAVAEGARPGVTGAASREVIVLGPGFFKEEIVAYAREKHFEANFHIEAAAEAGTTGINEVLKSGVSKILEKAKASEDERLMETLFTEIGRDGKCTYGRDHVLRALERGAVETLLVAEGFLHDPKMVEIGRLASETKVTIRVLSRGYDAGKRLDGLGGLAALLRYKLED
jgi:protein pelota